MKHTASRSLPRSTKWTLFAAPLFLLLSCKKPEDALGLDLLDPSDTLGLLRTDTFSIIAWTKLPDSAQTSGLSQTLVGSYVDPVFGRVTTGTVAQVRLSSNAVGPANDNWVCDSLVLSMVYASTSPIYGQRDPQVLRVYRLENALSIDSTYTNNRIPSFQPTDLVAPGTGAFTPVLDDGPIIGGDSLPAQLRIPLDPALGAELLGRWGQSEVADNVNFLAWFKGLYVVADNPGQGVGEGATWAFNLLNGNSKLTLYYHDSQVGTALKYDFIFSSSSVRYTTAVYEHSPTVQAALTDTALGQDLLYLRSMGGLRNELRIPGLSALAGSSLKAVAQAVLIVPVDGDHGDYAPPGQLFAFRKGSTGQDLLLPDQVSGQGQIGGLYNSTDQEYRLNVTRWVQGVLNGTYTGADLGFIAGSNGITVNRAVLNGPAHATRPMRMVVTFTTY